MAADLQLEEPANLIGAEVAAFWASSKGGYVVAPLLLTDARTDLLVANGGRADYIVAVAPANLNLFDVKPSLSPAWQRYGLVFQTYVRVFDARSGVLVGTAKCNVELKKPHKSPKYDEIMANNGERLREMIRRGSAKCVRQLRDGLTSPADEPAA
ncbi:MAG: hypothetical protein Q8J89_15620 [Caulobacter sp.]|nr:hypothetical protein [Caulobacter sp.]